VGAVLEVCFNERLMSLKAKLIQQKLVWLNGKNCESYLQEKIS